MNSVAASAGALCLAALIAVPMGMMLRAPAGRTLLAPLGSDTAPFVRPSLDLAGADAAAPSQQLRVSLEAACKLSGKVADCGCDFASVEIMNQQALNPLLSQLVTQPFFRFFKVSLYCDCQFWPDAGVCTQRDCCVDECGASDIPHAWRQQDLEETAAWEAQKRGAAVASCGQSADVDRSVAEDMRGALAAVPGWQGLNNPWVPQDDAQLDYIYVDLPKNQEKYTGYKGEDARRIWAAIYEQPAMRDAAAAAAASAAATAAGVGGDAAAGLPARPVPLAQRVLYRLVSGMHASITASIVSNYYDAESGTWGPNLPFFKGRFASPSSRPYIENLYFTLLFVLRAVIKAGPALRQLDYGSGWPGAEGHDTQRMVELLLDLPAVRDACPTPFDEGLLTVPDPEAARQLQRQLQGTFHNITRLLDCVGCEKCKLNGKLNLLGIATALKVAFSEQEAVAARAHPGPGHQPPSVLRLHRNEAIALINFLAKLSDSVEVVRSLSLAVAAQGAAAA